MRKPHSGVLHARLARTLSSNSCAEEDCWVAALCDCESRWLRASILLWTASRSLLSAALLACNQGVTKQAAGLSEAVVHTPVPGLYSWCQKASE